MRFFCRVAEWYRIACNHGDFVGYRRFVYFLMLAEMVRFLLISRGDVSRVLADYLFFMKEAFSASDSSITLTPFSFA